MSSHTVKHLAACSALSLLAACGGGGDGGGSTTATPSPTPTPAPTGLSIDSSNQQAAATAGAQAADQGSTAVNSVTGNSSGTQQTAASNAALALQLATGALRKSIQAAASDASNTTQCPGGGTLVFTFADANGNTTIDAGDTLTLQYSQCVNADQFTDGKIVLAIQQLQAANNTSTLQATYTNYVTASGGSGTRLNGAITVTTNGSLVSGTPTDPNSCSPSVNSSTFEKITADDVSLSGTTVSVVRSTTLSAGTVNTQISGDCSRSLNVMETAAGTWTGIAGVLRIATPAAIQSGADGIPYGGTYTVSADHGKVQVSFGSGGTALLQLDANGDGIFESSTNLTWAQLGLN